jgi:outer membrane protein assembly factor BamB
MSRPWINAAAIATILLLARHALASGSSENWPTYACDAQRSNATQMRLALPLTLAWRHSPAHQPQPAWPAPAKSDYWHNKHNLRPRVTCDRAFHVAVVGRQVFYGSSADDCIVSLDAETGNQRWSFFTEGPVRTAPTVWEGRVYVGSDDGSVYCLGAEDGKLLWRHRIGPDDRRCLGNGRMISRWPVRSGVVIADGVAYAAAGLFPTSEGAYLCALDAGSGDQIYHREIEQPSQGYLLASRDHLLIPSGRAAPGLYARADGARRGYVGSPGGSYAVIADDAIVAGSGDGTGRLALSESATRDALFTFEGRHVIATRGKYFVQSEGKLAALDSDRFLPLARQRASLAKAIEAAKRTTDDPSQTRIEAIRSEFAELTRSMQRCWQWRQPCEEPHALILAGEHLFAGGDHRVTAYHVADGQRGWSVAVEGRVYGLAAAGGSLFASTDTGQIYCFRQQGDALEQGVSNGQLETDRDAEPHVDAQDARYDRAAKRILQLSGADQGFCLVLDAGNGRLAFQIARNSRLRVVGVETDADLVARARQHLHQRGVYGSRVVIHHIPDDDLPYPDYFANLIVSQRTLDNATLPHRPAELYRVLRPAGGVMCLGPLVGEGSSWSEAWLAEHAWPETDIRHVDQEGIWTVIRRQPLAGGGEWTHGLADPGNTACTQDQHLKGDLQIQWFGLPGPRHMTDRHHRNVAPLAKDGRLFVPGDNLLMAVDAYNGTQLWQREFPASRRLGAFLDCSNMVVDEGALYFAEHQHCHELDPASGQLRRSFVLPNFETEPRRHWGYLAKVDGMLIGTASKPEARYYEQSRAGDLALWYDNMAVVTGEEIFGIDSTSGEVRWSYASGVLIHPTVTAGNGRVYFVESHSAKAEENPSGRVRVADFLPGPNYLVALDLKTGETLWRRDVDLGDCRHIVYLNYAQEKLLLSGNRYVDGRLWYFFRGIDAASGMDAWERGHGTQFRPGGDHGEQNRHPTIVDDTVYAFPLAYNLHTGESVADWHFQRMGHGCGNIAASAHSIYWRGGNPWRMDLVPGSQPHRINSVTRLGCWINTIPAGGLLLVPEASSGCTCAFPLQASLAYAPRPPADASR